MLERATSFRDNHIHIPKNYKDLLEIVQNGWAYSHWCESSECEGKVKEDSKATTRCMPLGDENFPGSCIVCGKKAKQRAYFARAY